MLMNRFRGGREGGRISEWITMVCSDGTQISQAGREDGQYCATILGGNRAGRSGKHSNAAAVPIDRVRPALA